MYFSERDILTPGFPANEITQNARKLNKMIVFMFKNYILNIIKLIIFPNFSFLIFFFLSQNKFQIKCLRTFMMTFIRL